MQNIPIIATWWREHKLPNVLYKRHNPTIQKPQATLYQTKTKLNQPPRKVFI